MNELTQAKQKQYRIDHREELAAKKKVYYLAHKEQIIEYQRAYKAKGTPLEVAESKKKGMLYYLERKQIINEKLRVKS